MSDIYKVLTANNPKLKETVEYINRYFYTADPKKPNEDYSKLIKDFQNIGFDVIVKKGPYVSDTETVNLTNDTLNINFYPHKNTSISFNEIAQINSNIRYFINGEDVEMIFVNDEKNLELLFVFQIEKTKKTKCVGVADKYKGVGNFSFSTELLSLIIENKNNKKEIYDIINLNYDINIKNNLILVDFTDIISNIKISKNKLSY